MARPWSEAWHEALYGADGLYVRDEPHEHFSTATSPGLVEVLASAVVALMRREGLSRLVDVAAGGGELASAVCDLAPDLQVTCVEVRPRPVELNERIEWVRSPGGARLPESLRGLRGAVVLAHEWLDNVPCVIAERRPPFRANCNEMATLVEVLVDADGTETAGDAVCAADLAWAQQWWPDGDRVEIGRERDKAWDDLVSRIDDGLAVAVDYGHLRGGRPEGGSLTAYRSGTVVDPVPDGSCDLTAHVAVDSLAQDRLVRQRDLFDELGLLEPAPDHALASTDPAGYLHALARRSAVAALTDPGGLGAFWWVLRRVPARVPRI